MLWGQVVAQNIGEMMLTGERGAGDEEETLKMRGRL